MNGIRPSRGLASTTHQANKKSYGGSTLKPCRHGDLRREFGLGFVVPELASPDVASLRHCLAEIILELLIYLREQISERNERREPNWPDGKIALVRS